MGGLNWAEHTIEIDAPIETCFEAIVDYESFPEWQRAVVDTEVLDRHKDGLGKKVNLIVDAKVRKVDYTLDYRYRRPTLIEWDFVEGNGINDADGSYTFEDLGGGRTRATYKFGLEVGIPLPGPVARRARVAKQVGGGEDRVVIVLDGPPHPVDPPGRVDEQHRAPGPGDAIALHLAELRLDQVNRSKVVRPNPEAVPGCTVVADQVGERPRRGRLQLPRPRAAGELPQVARRPGQLADLARKRGREETESRGRQVGTGGEQASCPLQEPGRRDHLIWWQLRRRVSGRPPGIDRLSQGDVVR